MSQQPQMSQELQRKLAIVQLASQVLDTQMKDRDVVTYDKEGKTLKAITNEEAAVLVEGCFVVATIFDRAADAFVQPSRVDSENPKKSSPLIGL